MIKSSVINGALVGVCTTVLSLPLNAQEEQGAELEEIVVTGSYLFNAADSPSPVTSFDGELLNAVASADMATFFFDNVPQNYANDNIAMTDASGMARSRSIRSATINLRGLGDENSLAVLNGRRTIAYPVPDGTGWTRTDINSLVPRIATQRIELLLDGGSAIFGSDPVAGVANFVTNNDFRGFDLQVDSRTLEEATSATNATVSGLFGAGNDRTDFIIAVEYHKEDRVLRSEIDPTFSLSPDVTPETGVGLQNQQGLEYSNGGMGMSAIIWLDPLCGRTDLFGPFAYYPAYEDPVDDERREVGTGSDPTAAAEFCDRPDGFDNGFDLYNNNVEQIIAFARLEHDFTDSLRINVELNWSDQTFDDIDVWGDGGTGQVWSPERPQNLGTAYSFPFDHPAILHAQSIDSDFGMVTAMGMTSYGPVYSIDETMPFLSEMSAFNKNDVSRIAIGLEGDFANSWTWLIDGSMAESNVANGIRDPIKSRYPDSMLGLGGPNCDPATGTPGAGDCFYYNPFMSSALPDAQAQGLANDPSLLEWLIPNRVDNFKGEFVSLDFRLVGEFGELRGGPIGFAVGAAYREETLERDADTLVNLGLTATTGVVNDFKGEQQVDSLYFELALPVHEDFYVQVAARHESYDIGFSELSPKLAGLWTPTDRLSVRASWGTSFKGPSISQTAAATIFQGSGPTQVTVDVNGIPTTFGAMGMFFAAFETRPNPALQPQTSDNLSIGFDFRVTDSIDVGASWVSIDFNDRIVANTANVVSSSLNCLITDANNLPVEEPGGDLQWLSVDFGGCIEPADPAFVGPNGEILEDNIGMIITSPVNLNYLNTEFLDVHASMAWDTAIGQLSFTPSVTYVLQYEFPLPDGSTPRAGLCPQDLCSSVGRTIGMGFANGINNMPRWQGNFPVSLRTGDHTVRLNTRYRDSLNQDIDDLAAQQAQNFVHEEGQWVADLSWNWQLNASMNLGIQARNLFATEPPATSSARFSQRLREYALTFRYTLER